jgi:hypothetical protein
MKTLKKIKANCFYLLIKLTQAGADHPGHCFMFAKQLCDEITASNVFMLIRKRCNHFPQGINNGFMG